MNLEPGAVDTLIRCSEGDLRKAITFLQSATKLVGATRAPQMKNNGNWKKRRVIKDDDDSDSDLIPVDVAADGMVTIRNVEEIAGVIPGKFIEDLIGAMQPQSHGSVYETVARAVTDLVADGWSASQIVTQVSIYFYSMATLCKLIPTDLALPRDHVQ